MTPTLAIRTCDHKAPAPVPRGARAAALARARKRFDAAGVRFTPARARALELLIKAGGPVKAYDLLAAFNAEASTAPPTVYRALDTLLALGLIHRIPSMSAFVACPHQVHEHAATFLICDCCGSAEEVMTPSPILGADVSREHDFEATSVSVEYHGRCSRCRV